MTDAERIERLERIVLGLCAALQREGSNWAMIRKDIEAAASELKPIVHKDRFGFETN